MLIDLKVSSKQVNFKLNPNLNREIAILSSSIWGSSISISQFQPFELFAERIEFQQKNQTFVNPLKISLIDGDGKLRFLSESPDISIQEVVCDSGSSVEIQRDDQEIRFRIRSSAQTAYVRISLGEEIRILARDCKIVDAEGRDFTALFSDTLKMKPHPVSKSILVQNNKKPMDFSINQKDTNASEKIDFFIKQDVSALNFYTEKFIDNKIQKISTIDSLSIITKFPLVDQKANEGDIELDTTPEDFFIYTFFALDHSLHIRAQGKFKSIKLGRGLVKMEALPKYLAFITEHPVTSLSIAWIGWLMAAIPFFAKYKSKNKMR
jgi:hypothetical protein